MTVLDERERLARDLHDSVCQSLFSMAMHTRALELAAAREGCSPDGPLGTGIALLRDLAQEVHAEMRSVLFQLRPDGLRRAGLVAAIREHAEAVARRGGPAVRVIEPQAPLDLDDSTEDELFRVVREAVHNCVKHASARSVEVRFGAQPGTLVVEVADDGCGFSGTEGMGLSSMRDRLARLGGTLVIISSPAGSVVRAVLPT
ncbi:hypothetical protein Lesp02_13790 [Lentzea sp. NBRC 105346]|uniref:sensor histidine kinase n=1 Tax=Lentzea sp. NBRC 105346 TaxID=3032205 RepID=UPI0024A51E15|nr:sensor histidine kinase [Lentzea sp. NBRC 105346]GLZ29189.1 hypothetical protein Lesp02_13790 [Lentzea sp. NBRC 105346]